MLRYACHIALFGLIAASACCHETRFPPGGYPYPEKIPADRTFYYYPVRDKGSRVDSFRAALEFRTYQAFDEPNLSLRPQPGSEFRFVYGGTTLTYFIVLRPYEIVTKKGIFPPPDELPDTNKLPPLRPFSYDLKRIKISTSGYDSLVGLINASGYWKMPYLIDCYDGSSDGYGYLLEANTPEQYNIVCRGSSCSAYDTTKFPQACEALIVAAGLNKEIGVAWDGISDTTRKHAPIVVQDVQLQQVERKPHKKHKKP